MRTFGRAIGLKDKDLGPAMTFASLSGLGALGGLGEIIIDLLQAKNLLIF